MTRRFLLPALAMTLCLAVALPASGQTSTGGDFEGIVRDTSGAVLPGVVIVATNETTGVRRETVSSSSGRYYLPALPPGRYTVHAELTGFTPVQRTGVELQVGDVRNLDFELQVGQLSESITVTQEAPIVETTRAQLGAVVNQQDIQNLPINGRNFLDFAVTVPGVTDTRNTGQGSGFSVNGQRQRSNNVSVDGVDSNGQLNGNTRMTLSQEAVQEFQVVTNQFAPEFGRSGGGIVNVVSKSGSNQLSGSAFLFVRDESLDARNAMVPADEPKPPFRRKNTGGSLGGPIVQNKTFFFGAYEWIDRDESDVTTISDTNLAIINDTLRVRPIPNAGVTSITNGTFPVTDTTTFASFKLDHAFSSTDQVNFRYNYGKRDEINAGGVSIGGLTAPEGGGGRRTRDHAVVAGFLHAFTPSLLSDARVQYAPRKQEQYSNDPVGPRVTISGVATFGRSTDFPVKLDETRWQFVETLNWQREKHFVKGGVDVNYVNALTSFPSAFAGSFSFGSLATFLSGRPTTFTQGFGNPMIRLKDTLVGLFVQDSFRVNPRLTLVYGLRYDYDAQPQDVPRDRSNPIEAPLADGINRDGNNWQPRASVVFDVLGDARNVMRAGYGRFYDKIFLLVARNVLLARQSISLSGQAAADRFALGAWPESGTLPSGVTLGATNIQRPDPGMELPYNDQVTVEFERQIGNDWSAGIGYVFVRGRQLLVADNINLAPPVVLTVENAASLGVANPTPQQIGRNYYTRTRLDPNFNQINQVSSTGRGQYHGMQLDLQKRMRRGLQLRASYVLSSAKDDGSDFTQAEMPDDPYNRAAEYAYSMEHQRHRFTLTGVWQVPSPGADSGFWGVLARDWTTSALLKYRSGTPRKITIGSDVNGDGRSETDRPFVNGVIMERNSVMGPDYVTLDLRLSRKVPLHGRASLQVIAEAFNLLNRVNYAGVNNTWGTALEPRSTLGEYTSANDPRQLQFGVRLQF